MRRALVLAAVAALVLAGTALAATIAKPIPGETLKSEIAAFNARNYAAAYTAYTARFKAGCPYATFRRHQAAQRAQAPSAIKVRITSTRVTGSRALLNYQILLGSQVVATAKNDLFVRIGGLWYDEVDKQTTC
jgi:hypothetical protein